MLAWEIYYPYHKSCIRHLTIGYIILCHKLHQQPFYLYCSFTEDTKIKKELIYFWQVISITKYLYLYLLKYHIKLPCRLMYIDIIRASVFSMSNIFKIPLFQNSFSDIARVLSEFFRDLDVVPGDVVVGLVLLRQRQQLLRLRVVHQVMW